MLELPFGIDGQAEGHGWHLRVEGTIRVYSEGPDVFALVVRDGESAAVRRQGDSVRACDAGIGGGCFAGFAVDAGDFLGSGFRDENESVGGDG